MLSSILPPLAATQTEFDFIVAGEQQNVLITMVIFDGLEVRPQTTKVRCWVGFCRKSRVDRSNQLRIFGQHLAISKALLSPFHNLPRLQFANRFQLFAAVLELALALILVKQVATGAENGKSQQYRRLEPDGGGNSFSTLNRRLSHLAR